MIYKILLRKLKINNINPTKTESELECSGRVSSSCSTSDIVALNSKSSNPIPEITELCKCCSVRWITNWFDSIMPWQKIMSFTCIFCQISVLAFDMSKTNVLSKQVVSPTIGYKNQSLMIATQYSVGGFKSNMWRFYRWNH